MKVFLLEEQLYLVFIFQLKCFLFLVVRGLSQTRDTYESPSGLEPALSVPSQPPAFYSLLLSKSRRTPPQYCTSPCPSFPRLEKGEAATGVDITCTIHSGPAGPRLDKEQLYWELSRETYGITQLGSFTLDRDSLYVNGEGLCSRQGLSPGQTFVFLQKELWYISFSNLGSVFILMM